MKKRIILSIILTGFLLFPVVISLNQINTSYNLPIANPTNISFQLSSLTTFSDNTTLPLPNTDQIALQARISIDSNNVLHLTYVNSTNQAEIMYTNSSDYTVVRKVSNNPYNDTSPAIAVFRNSTMHRVYIVWEASNGTQTDIVISNSSDYFSTNLTISTNTSISDNAPDIVIDSLGVVHVVWEAPHNVTGNAAIWYTNSSSNYKIITEISQDPTDMNTEPCIAVDSNNVIHVAWVAPTSGSEVVYANSTDNFQTNTTLVTTLVDKNPDIISTNPVIIAWSADITGDKIVIADSSRNWAIQTVSTNAVGDDEYPRVVKGPGNVVHLIWISEQATSYQIKYKNNLDNYTTETIIGWNATPSALCDIAVGTNGKIHIIWGLDKQVYYSNSTYPSFPAVKLLSSIMFPQSLTVTGTPLYVLASFFDEMHIDEVQLVWSSNNGISWNTFMIIGTDTYGNGTHFDGWSAIPGYQYGVFLQYKYKIIDKAGQSIETNPQIFYYPDTRTESIALIIILFGVLGTITALYLIPQTREFFGKLFSKEKEQDPTKKLKTES